MKFFEILTQYDFIKEDVSFDIISDSFVITEDEYSEDLLTKITESKYAEGMKLKSMEVKEIAPEEVSKVSQEIIINQIIPNIYKEYINLPDDMPIREFVKLRKEPSFKALALKQFEEKYSIYRMLKQDLDFTKITVAELFDKIEKIYRVRLTDEYLDVYRRCIIE